MEMLVACSTTKRHTTRSRLASGRPVLPQRRDTQPDHLWHLAHLSHLRFWGITPTFLPQPRKGGRVHVRAPLYERHPRLAPTNKARRRLSRIAELQNKPKCSHHRRKNCQTNSPTAQWRLAENAKRTPWHPRAIRPSAFLPNESRLTGHCAVENCRTTEQTQLHRAANHRLRFCRTKPNSAHCL